MNRFLIILGVLVAIIVLFVVFVIILTPWMDRWGTTADERSTEFPGDDLVKSPARMVNRGVTIKASPNQIYPWILQIGADKSGMYSYTWLENLVGCKMAKDEVIRPEWQKLKEGDLMKMCAGDFAPPPYILDTRKRRNGSNSGHLSWFRRRMVQLASSPVPEPTW